MSHFKAIHTAIIIKLGSRTINVDERLGLVHRTVLGSAAVSDHPKSKVNGHKSEQGRRDWALNDQHMRL